jgi:hypothetical protein
MPVAAGFSKAKLEAYKEAEQQRLNVLANLELLKQELSGLAGAREWLTQPLFHGGRVLNFLLPTEDIQDLPDSKVSWLLSNLTWIRWAIKNNKHQTKT